MEDLFATSADASHGTTIDYSTEKIRISYTEYKEGFF